MRPWHGPDRLQDGQVLLQLPSAAMVNAARMVLLEMPCQFDVSGDMGAVGRVDGPAPTLQEQVSLEASAAAAAASGSHDSSDMLEHAELEDGAGGDKQVQLDLKGESTAARLVCRLG